MRKRFFWLAILPVLVAGCAARFTNLTPGVMSRSTNNLYQVSVKFSSRQQTLDWKTIQAYVQIQTNLIPMEPTPFMTNRWEAYIYIPPSVNLISYRYLFKYETRAFGPRKQDSAASQYYTLKIVE